MIIVRGEDDLAAFRSHWSGERILDLLSQCGGRMRIDWAVGVGKSTSIDQTITAAITKGAYDLVLALLPTRRVLQERAWIKQPPADVRIANLRPRPRKRCGEKRDREWQDFERRDLGAFGRLEICSGCPRRDGCFWRRQYGKGLRGIQVIFATQAHLERSPNFVLQVSSWTQAQRILVLLDEANFVMKSCRRRIEHEDLVNFIDVLKRLPRSRRGKSHRDWIYKAELLLKATTRDLRVPEWRMPFFFQEWALTVQRLGLTLHGSRFRFLGYAILQFGYSPLESRERDPNGDLSFSAPPYLNCDFIIYSGTAHTEFSRFRLGRDFSSPFAEYGFEHPESRWYNIASRVGTKVFFERNAPQVLDFFAGLVARRIREGRRPLLVAKKCFVRSCAAGLEARLRNLGLGEVTIATSDWRELDLTTSSVVPLINYGMIGTNLFEDFECAYCLTGYYVTKEVVNSVLQDVLASDGHIPIEITTGGRPRRRKAGVQDPKHRSVDVHHLAQLALEQQEMDVVLQAVGRVRPYTRPREVITFQCAAHPQLEYAREFHSFGEAREYFQIPSRREREKARRRAQIEALRSAGLSQRAAAEQLGVSLITVKRYWSQKEVSRTL